MILVEFEICSESERYCRIDAGIISIGMIRCLMIDFSRNLRENEACYADASGCRGE